MEQSSPSPIGPAIKTVIFTFLVPGSATVFIPLGILPKNSLQQLSDLDLLHAAAFFPMLMGLLIFLRCAFDFVFAGRGTPAPIDPPKELVVRGLYRYVRNPMYVGIILILIGEAWLFGSWVMAVYAASFLTIFNLFVLFYEEPVLEKKFGESYRRYCATTSRWIPHPPRDEPKP